MKNRLEEFSKALVVLVTTSVFIGYPVISQAGFLDKFKEKIDSVQASIDEVGSAIDESKQALDENKVKLKAAVDKAESVKNDVGVLAKDIKEPAVQKALQEEAKNKVKSSKGVQQANSKVDGAEEGSQKALGALSDLFGR